MPFRNLIFDYVLTLSIRIYRFQRFLFVGAVYQRYQFFGKVFVKLNISSNKSYVAL
jgi:hypothetical protein